jgi:hypothetical protein
MPTPIYDRTITATTTTTLMNTIRRPREESSLRREMRRAQRRRLLSWRPLQLCVIATVALIVIAYLQIRQGSLSANTAAFWQHHDDPFDREGASQSHNGWMREKNLFLTALRSRSRRRSETPPAALQTEFAVPPLHQFTSPHQRRSDDDQDDNSVDDSERYHNPSLYGWTPEVYPDPLLNPIRCAIAYLPETNMTDGLR